MPFIRNTTKHTFAFRVLMSEGAEKVEQLFFPCLTVDKYSNTQMHSGFTEVSDYILKQLKENDFYKQCSELKLLVETDKLPETALEGEQLIAFLRQKVARLEQEVVTLTASLAEYNGTKPDVTASGGNDGLAVAAGDRSDELAVNDTVTDSDARALYDAEKPAESEGNGGNTASGGKKK